MKKIKLYFVALVVCSLLLSLNSIAYAEQISDVYTLTDVSTYTIDYPDITIISGESGVSFFDKIVSAFYSVFYKIQGVSQSGTVYFSDDYEVYTFDGAQKLKTTFTIHKGVKKNLSKKLPDSIIEKAVGFSVSAMYGLSTDFTYTVKQNQKITVKVYPIYKKTTFGTVNRFSGKSVGNGTVYKPSGLYISVATYTK